MLQTAIYDLFVKALRQVAMEVAALLPKIALAIVVLAAAALTIKLLNKVFGRILGLVDLDGAFKKLARVELPFSLTSIIILLMDVGVALVALLGIAGLFLNPQQMELVKGLLGYAARIASVIVVTILTFMMFNALVDRIRVETRMRGYVLLILLIIVTVMIVDLTALEASTKRALVEGLSMGLGIAIGVFAAWFFFREYLDRLTGVKPSRPANVERP